MLLEVEERYFEIEVSSIFGGIDGDAADKDEIVLVLFSRVVAGAQIRKLSFVIIDLLPALIPQIVVVKMQAVGQSLEGVASVHVYFFVVAE